MKRIAIMLCLLGTLLVSCGGANTPTAASQMPIAIEGYVQKGPFVRGSTVYFQELDDDFIPTGDMYFTRTIDDLGSFLLTAPFTSSYVDIMTQGYYFNEVSGALSESTLTLTALTELSKSGSTLTDTSLNLNILTTLTRDRIQYLIEYGGLTFEEARQQVREEILTVFHIAGTDITDASGLANFEVMDITKTGDNNAVLLATSAILQGSNTTGELSELVSKIVQDMKETGILDNQTYIDELKNNGKGLSVSEIRTNMGDRYYDLDQDSLIDTIPMFEDFIDSDGDGTINRNDSDTYIWGRTLPNAPSATNVAEWRERFGHTSVVFNDKIWIIGGGYYTASTTSYTVLNDVWSSPDGINWTQEVEHANWSARFFHSSVVYDGKIWVIGGRTDINSSGSLQVWSSTDGINWKQGENVGTYAPVPGYHGAVVYDDKIWVVNTASAANTKVYYTSDGETWTDSCIPGLCTLTLPNLNNQNYQLVILNNKMWLIGGSYSTMADEVWSSSDGASWTKEVDAAPWGGRARHTAVFFENEIWIAGGDSVDSAATYNGDVWHSPDGINWTQAADTAHWAQRYDHSSVVTSFGGANKIWLMGGRSDTDLAGENDVWYYTNYCLNYSSTCSSAVVGDVFSEQ